ncbi:MAG: hypothetical protein WD056_01750, partial [Gemmatimonadota bacterium]
MREFQDDTGRVWVAGVRERPGTNYKGRFGFVAHPKDLGPTAEVSLEDVRWNRVETARRTLETMSEVELVRRLRSA